MKEIVQLYDGGCGDRIGSLFGRMISQEHGLTPDGMVRCGSWSQMEGLPVMFHETRDRRFHPRSVMLKKENNIEDVMDMIRRQVEMCDVIQGFTLCHSLSSSKLMSDVMTGLRDEFCDSVLATFSVMDDDHDVMMLHDIVNMTDINIMFDNRTIHDTCVSQLGISRPCYSDINHLISLVMSGITASLRFPELNNPITDLHQLEVRSVPSPGLQLLQPILAPLTICKRGHNHLPSSPSQLIGQLLEPGHNLTSTAGAAGTQLTMTSTFRGPMSRAEVEDNIKEVNPPFGKMTSNVVSVCPPCVKYSACCVTNSTSIIRVLPRMNKGSNLHNEKDDLVYAHSTLDAVLEKYRSQKSASGKL